MSKKLSYAALVGIVPAILEFLLVYSFEPTASGWLLLQVSLYWFTCGVANYLVDLRLPQILGSILFTVFLTSPWYIAESVMQGKPEHFVPLVVASIAMGLVIGLLCKWLKRKEAGHVA
ncbi:MAG: hypothetical protein GC192_04830 [Bacteroidetes bacterium]|nr:hypothetical protein [Bacteroidota bacterium]